MDLQVRVALPGDAQAHRELLKRVPIGRLGWPIETAEAVVSLVMNSFITAQTVLVDGGIYPR